MRRIAVINQKGGVGKTTTAVNLGAALTHLGRRVCLIDVDAQANLSLHLDIESESGTPSTYTVLSGASTMDEAIRTTKTKNLVVVPSNLDLSGAELELASAIGRESLMRDAIDAWETKHKESDGRAPADYVIFDCPPSLGLLSVNALAAANEVVLTLQTEFFALQGMSKLVEVVQILRRRLNPGLLITGILPCLYDSRLRLAREVLGEIRTYFPGEVFRQPIRTNVKLAEAPSYGQTIFEYAADSNGARDYLSVARELIEKESRDPELAGLPEPPSDAEVARTLRGPTPVRTPPPPPARRAAAKAAPEAQAAPAKPSKPETQTTEIARPTTASVSDPDKGQSGGEGETLRYVVLEPKPRSEPTRPAATSPSSSPAPAAPAAEPAGPTGPAAPGSAGPGPTDDAEPAARQGVSPEAAKEAPRDRSQTRPRDERASTRIVRAKDLPPLPKDAFDSMTSYVRGRD